MDENPLAHDVEPTDAAEPQAGDNMNDDEGPAESGQEEDGLNENAKRMKPDPAMGAEAETNNATTDNTVGETSAVTDDVSAVTTDVSADPTDVAAAAGAVHTPGTSNEHFEFVSIPSTRNYRRSSSNLDNIDEESNPPASDLENTIEIDDHTSYNSESEIDLASNQSDDSNAADAAVLSKDHPKDNWFIVPELFQRELGYSLRKQQPSLFQRRCYGSLHCVKRLKLMYKLEGHSGCVNHLNFHPTGQYLASGSDDLNVVIWDWQNGKPLLQFDTKHRSNVFQSQFLPLSGDLHIVTAGRDGQIRLHQVSAQEGLRSTRKLGSHRGACHKVTPVAEQPHVVLSAGADGMVLKHDVRNPKPENLVNVRTETDSNISLYSIHGHPLNGNEFCVSGRDFNVRTYDQRNCSTTVENYHPFDSKNDGAHVTCAIYNHDGSEILASYCDEDIYLFDVKQPIYYIHKYQGHRNRATIKGVNFFGPKSEFIVSGSDCGHFYFWDRNSEAIVNWLKGDEAGVVNCLEPHPQLPYICSSGLDWDVKVWMPNRTESPNMADIRQTVNDNMKDRSFNDLQCNEGRQFGDTDLLWMLWQHLSDRDDMSRTYNGGTFNRRAFHVAMDAIIDSDDDDTTDPDSNHNSDNEISDSSNSSENSDGAPGSPGCTTS